jgi:signal transduction histidine kinase
MDENNKKMQDLTLASTAPAGFFQEISIEFLIHELKDPVAVVEAGLRNLLEREDKFGPLTEKQANTLRRSLRGTRKAWGLLNDLLEIGRSQSGCLACSRFRPLASVRQALKDALETVTGPAAEEIGTYQLEGELIKLLTRHGIFIEVPAHAAESEMLQDETKFRLIAGNLFKNALHHRKKRMDVHMGLVADRFVLSVTDDGAGIDPEHHELIFRRYTQLKECTFTERRGHGIGLAGAQILARSLGGDIEVNSRKGAGATFRLALPLEFTPAREDRAGIAESTSL